MPSVRLQESTFKRIVGNYIDVGTESNKKQRADLLAFRLSENRIIIRDVVLNENLEAFMRLHFSSGKIDEDKHLLYEKELWYFLERFAAHS